MAANKDIQVSVVIPCFNEERTVGETIVKAKIGLSKLPFSSEILLIDNNSTDNSAKIASSLGVSVIFEREQGYGYALLRGFEEAKGRYIFMGDADNTYDLSELDKFIKPLTEGCDLVTGTRLKGNILPGAMKWLHRYVGNPLITFLINLLFGANVSDAECGMRAFTKEAYRKMRLQAGGMELISEIIVKAAKAKLKIIELPITYYPRKGESKLRSFYDGWRNMRFLMQTIFSSFFSASFTDKEG